VVLRPFVVIGIALMPYPLAFAGNKSCDDDFARAISSLVHRNDGSALIYSQRMADRLSRMDPASSTRKVITAGMDQQDLVYVYGVPPGFKRIQHQGQMVFRHYTRDAVDAIVSSRTLRSGPRPFIDPAPHARLEYQDLTGSMFTTPEVKASELWMDLKDQSDWVEFTLVDEVPVFWCKDKNYLIPMQKNYPDWIRSDYEEYLRTGVSRNRLDAEYARLRDVGGMTPIQSMPIRIKRYQKNGVIRVISP
jgi:hypothetical protein